MTYYKKPPRKVGKHLGGTFASTRKAVENATNHELSHYQVAIYDWLAKGTGHAIVQAVAGSGKTTTIEYAPHFLPQYASILMVAYNKHIADELNARMMPENVEASTLHSAGYKVLSKALGYIKVDENKTKWILMNLMGYKLMQDKEEKKAFWEMYHPMHRMVDLLKNFGFYALRPAPTPDDVIFLANRYQVELTDNFGMFFEMLLKVMEEVKKPGEGKQKNIDWSDMLWMPLLLKLPFPKYEFVFVDESQDLNPIQIAMVRQFLSAKGRACFVGDKNQAIYGFRGADPEAMNEINTIFNAIELPLSISFRCPKLIVEAAKELVPQIEASPYAYDGEIRHMNAAEFTTDVKSGDFVLGRTTAPLVRYCLQFIKLGKKACVRGRDIGQGLITTIEKIADLFPVHPLQEAIELFAAEEYAKLNKPGMGGQLLAMTDKIDTLKVLASEITTYAGVIAKINDIFSDKVEAITLATVHRAKGLEANRIFVVRPDLLPHPLAVQEWQEEQEWHLKYVAITRVKNGRDASLTWVHDERGTEQQAA